MGIANDTETLRKTAGCLVKIASSRDHHANSNHFKYSYPNYRNNKAIADIADLIARCSQKQTNANASKRTQEMVSETLRPIGIFSLPNERPYLAIISLKTGEIVERIFIDHSVGLGSQRACKKTANDSKMIPAG